MQRVSAFLPSWDRRKRTSLGIRTSLFSASSSGSSSRINTPTTATAPAGPSLSDRIRREVFWPSSLDRECDKAGTILKSFCTDGCLAPADEQQQQPPVAEGEPSQKWITKRIPPQIIQNAAAIAVFTCMRSGLWMTGSGGSGILIARKSDGTWSPPSGIILHTPTLSFIIGIDIYDCILIVNNLAALESMLKPTVVLGEDVGLSCGPLVPLAGPPPESDKIRCKDLGNTVFAYLKSRGQIQDVNLNGCILTERANENERFYGPQVTVLDVLAGNVRREVTETTPLFEVIKAAEGRTDFDPAVIARLSVQPAPGDAILVDSPKLAMLTPATPVTPSFGIPGAGDPDPFGVLALEMAGLEIREAGSRLRPTSSQFEFSPSPTSPAFSRYNSSSSSTTTTHSNSHTTTNTNRQSVDTCTTRSNRASYISTRTTRSQMTDTGTQTDTANTPATTPSPTQSADGRPRSSSFENLAALVEVDEIDYTKVDLPPLQPLADPATVDPAAADGTGAAKLTGQQQQQQRGGDRLSFGPNQPATATESLHQTDGDDNQESTTDHDNSIGDDDEEYDHANPNHHYHDSDREGEDEQSDEDDEVEDAENEEDEDEDEEEPVVYEVAAAVQPTRTAAGAPRVIHAAKGSIVTIKRQPPPPIPTRSAARNSHCSSLQSELPATPPPGRSARPFVPSISDRGDDDDDDVDDYASVSSMQSSSYTPTKGSRWSPSPTEESTLEDTCSASLSLSADTCETSDEDQPTEGKKEGI